MTQLKHLSLVSFLALAAALPAAAQQTPPDDQDTTTSASSTSPQAGRDVVVVTANKREESVQDVAVAVTAVTAETREELGIRTMTDLTNFTPGLSYTAANERVTLRGVGRNTNNFGAEPGVANYTDGVYESFATIAGRDPLFIDRVEVLRGPQGTLYGRNSLGGAINIISKRPTDEFKGEFRLGAGNYDSMKVGGSVSGPILGEALRGRAAALLDTREKGFYFNRGTGDTEGYNVHNWNGEVQLDGKLSDRFEWWTKYTFGTYKQAGPPGGRTGSGSAAPYNRNFVGVITPNPAWAFSSDPSIFGFTQTGSFQEDPRISGSTDLNDSYETVASTSAYSDYALQAIYHADNFDIKYVGGYVYYNYHLNGDSDGTPVKTATYDAITGISPFCIGAPTLQGWYGWPNSTLAATTPAFCYTHASRTISLDTAFNYNENRAFFSNEINLISTGDGPLQWITGIYAYQENFSQPSRSYLLNEPTMSTRQIAGTSTILPNPDGLLSYTNDIGLNNAYGAFAQVDYEFSDTLKATLGLRYSLDNKHMREEASLNCFIICNSPVVFGGQGGLLTNNMDITQIFWNGVNPADPTTPQPGVASATALNPSGVTYNAATGVSQRLLKDEWDAWSGTAGLEWRPFADTMVYGKYSRGYKTGGFNAQSMAPLPLTDPEYLDAYELGYKQEFLPWNLTANIAAFLYDYTDIQTPLTEIFNAGQPGETSITALRNVPKAQTTGFELESIWRPVDDLTLRFAYSYLHPEVKESGVYFNALVPTNITNTADPAFVDSRQSVKGNVLPFSPENKIALNATYNFNFQDGSALTPSVSYYWREGFSTSLFGGEGNVTPSFDQTDLNVLWRDADGLLTVIGWVRNVFDKAGYDSLSSSLRLNPNVGTAACTPGAVCFDQSQLVSATNVPGVIYQNFTLTQPRTYGVELQIHF